MNVPSEAVPPIFVTEENHRRLMKLCDSHGDGALAGAVEQLELELERAEVVEPRAIPPDVVTMRSKVVFEDVETRQWREAELVYPEEADIESSKISVLAPVGMALLGLSRGQSIRWPMPGARTRTLRVVNVVYQPEAAASHPGA